MAFTAMNRVQRVIVCVAISLVFVTASPKYGERLKKDDNHNHNRNQTDILQVFRPKGATPAPNRPANINQLSASDSKQKPIVDKKKDRENDTQRDTNNNQMKDISSERHLEYKFSAIHEKIDDNDNNSDDNNTKPDVQSSQPVLQHRSGPIDNKQSEGSPQPLPIHHFEFHPPDFSEFQFAFPDIAELASEHISGPPVPPPPPKVPRKHSPMSAFHGFHAQPSHQERNYEQAPNRQSFYETAPQHQAVAHHNIDPDFSFNIPQGFPSPQSNPRADFKKQQMGAQNTKGKPFGTKMSYTYRDPKNPNNFMEMSEVRMTVNREMNPQEAQSQIQQFIAAAQSGQYGPLAPVGDHQHSDERHPNHNYETAASEFDPEPKEPAEPKFPNF